jgi:formylglycine-generating enzyme required for sulfatase activity
MRYVLECPACAERLKIEEKHAGREVCCPACSARLQVSADAGRLPLLTNSIGMPLALIPAGHFDMGTRDSIEELMRLFPDAPASAREWFSREHPVHRVGLTRPYYLGKSPVTVGQFDVFVRATGYLTEAESSGGAYCWTGNEMERDPKTNWRSPGFAQGDDHPVVCVSWNDATAFCKWLSEKEGNTYRLPTEAQWEYASRAGTATLWSFGNDQSRLGEYAWFNGNSSKGTHSVGEKKPNAWGLYDMYGNVWEWCGDWLAEDYYRNSPSENPPGAATGSSRVDRGGCWDDPACRCRSAGRGRGRPVSRSIYLGFRVSLVPADGQDRVLPAPGRSPGGVDSPIC